MNEPPPDASPLPPDSLQATALQEADLHRRLGLTDSELAAIVELLGRDPTELELAMYAVMWSEHCSYKSSKVHLRRFPTKAPWVLVGPGEGAGVVDVGDGLAVAIRIESHNHPSAVEPYQGAATGVGGIIRDIFSMGARPIAVMDPLRFGRLDDARTRYLFEGVVSGISGYGNAVGVPTVGGEVVFDDCYRDNPLVNVFCLGLLPQDRLVLARAEGEGNLAVLLGSSTGRDGIGGASVLASAGFDDTSDGGSDAKRPSVQVGDPFEEKRLIEACLALLDAGLATGVQDLGAAGLCCAASETAAKTGAGMDVDFARVPQREPGMNAVEVMTSESQERMLAIVRPEDLEEVLSLCRQWDIRASVVGRVTDTARFRVFDGAFDAPATPDPTTAAGRHPVREPRRRPGLRPSPCAAREPERAAGRRSDRRAPLACPRRHRPLRRAARAARDADDRRQVVGLAPVRPPAVPQHRRRSRCRRRGAAPEGNRPRARAGHRRQGPVLPARSAHGWAARRARGGPQRRVRGARPLALVNCLNFGNPEHPEVMWQFSEVVDGMSEACVALGLPVVGGNVSFYNESRGADIDPTPVVAVVGLIDELDAPPPVARLVPGQQIVVLGETRVELGGSEWAAVVHGLDGGMPPAADLDLANRLHALVRELVAGAFVDGIHDCSDGGLAVTLAEMAIAGGCGFHVAMPDGELTAGALPAPVWCFAESASRVVVSVVPELVADVLEQARRLRGRGGGAGRGHGGRRGRRTRDRRAERADRRRRAGRRGPRVA